MTCSLMQLATSQMIVRPNDEVMQDVEDGEENSQG